MHASCVAHGRLAVLILGPSGTGKSALAIELLGLGARLVADDRTILAACADGPPVARAPQALSGLIEARGVGLLKVAPAPPTPLGLVVDMGAGETERLPPARTVRIMGAALPMLHKVEKPYFAAAVLLYLGGGTQA